MKDSFGIVIYDKKSGETSFSSLSFLKSEYNTSHIGHTGTLDKFASGLMIALIGKASRLNEAFSSFDKEYFAEIEFGKETDTLDPEGNVVREAPIPSFDAIKEKLGLLSGRILQRPPRYSALHIGGKRSSDIARKGIDITPDPREIEIYSKDIISFENGILKIRLSVSKGTYIRSFARDIGLLTQSAAYLKSLRRTKIGPFDLDDISLKTDEIIDKTRLFSRAALDESHRFEIENGKRDNIFIIEDEDKERPYLKLYFQKELYGYGKRGENSFSLTARL